MKQEMKKQPTFSLGKQIAVKEQKKVLGGMSVPAGRRCKGTPGRDMAHCTTANITQGYCNAVWSGTTLCTCGVDWGC
jgi:hypothetical protein